MATNRGAPGVRIKVIDNSAYELVENPALIAGIVGFSPKGELNKILKINNTSVQDNTLGLGYNQPKWNMGLYATRAVLNQGGHVHFVRPYGEQVVRTDPYKSDLKSDAFVVAFDRAASKTNYTGEDVGRGVHTSFDIRHFAATRYVADGMAGFGGKRKINTIQETIASNTNIDFYLTAGEEFNEEGKLSDTRGTDTNTVLFAMVNSDPTSAQRAADRYVVSSVKASAGTGNRFVFTCESVPAFDIGDTIYIPGSIFDGAHKATGVTATVIRILDTDVTIELDDTVENSFSVPFAFYCNNDDTTTGVDYLSVKTAVANRSVKKYGKIDYKTTGGIVNKFIPGQTLALYNIKHEETAVRLYGVPVENPSAGVKFERDIDEQVIIYTKNAKDESNVMIGDSIKFYYNDNGVEKSFTGTVSYVEDDNSEFECTVDNIDKVGYSYEETELSLTVDAGTATFAAGDALVEKGDKINVSYTKETPKTAEVTITEFTSGTGGKATSDLPLLVTKSASFSKSGETITVTLVPSDDTNKAFTFTTTSTTLAVGYKTNVATKEVTTETAELTVTDVDEDNNVTASCPTGFTATSVKATLKYEPSITKYEVTPGESTCSAVAKIVRVSLPNNRLTVKKEAKTGLSYSMVESTETDASGNTLYIKNKLEFLYTLTDETELLNDLYKSNVKKIFKDNDSIIVTLDVTDKDLKVQELYSKGLTFGEPYIDTQDSKYKVKCVLTLSKVLNDGKANTEKTDISKVEIRALTNDYTYIKVDDIVADYVNSKQYYVTNLGLVGALTLNNMDGTSVADATVIGDESKDVNWLYNLTATTDNILAALGKAGFAINNYVGEDVTYSSSDSTTLSVQVPAGTSTKYNVGDLVTFVEQKRNGSAEEGIFSINELFTIKNINTFKDIIVLDTTTDLKNKFGTDATWKLVDTTASNASIWCAGKDGLTFMMLGAYGVDVAAAQQLDDFLVSSYDADDVYNYMSTPWFTFVYTEFEGQNGTVQRSDKVLISDEVGATFSALGLAKVEYEDINFSGKSKQMYVLSPDGEAIARMYLYILYHFNGKTYEMEGTIVPYVFGDTNLFIGDVADTVLEGTGAKLLINDSGILDNFITNNAYDLSQTVQNGLLDSVSTMLAFDERDPAIINDAIWTYLPQNNNDTSTLSNTWNLFLDKDNTDVGMLVSAGTCISNLFMKNRELLNTSVISAMLDVCELRKDCFAIFDGVGEANIETALRKMIGAQSFGVKGRWGAMYDGRGIFFDSYYTLMNVEVVKSVQLASIITANASNGIWWFPPSGETQAVVPAEWGTSEKYPRTFKFPEDTDSDIARLIEIHINPTRSNDKGMFIWGDYTLQKAKTAFDQVHVAMLIAGIHKMFYHYLDKKVFQLNTTALRSDISSDLQAQLDMIKNSNPAGLVSGAVICDDTNNTPDVIDRNELIVDLKLKPTKTSRYITLRTTVESNGSSNSQSTAISV